jgi:medium-chain acyl-[acyl-carrier-protein] hydrolase
MSAIQTYIYKIRSYHTDASGRLFIHQLLNFLQDAAHNHADGFGFGQKQLVDHDLFWVLSRLTIEISSLPKRGEEVKLSTWVKSIRGSISEREFSISLAEQVLVNASSLWFSVSGHSHKPSRLPVEYSNLMAINDTYATVGGSEKVAEPGTESDKSAGINVTAHHSDIDMVDHVNNATYARWMMDEMAVDFQQKNKIKKLNINYLGECFLGEKVIINHAADSQSGILHEVIKGSSNKVICRAQSCWHKQ